MKEGGRDCVSVCFLVVHVFAFFLLHVPEAIPAALQTIIYYISRSLFSSYGQLRALLYIAVPVPLVPGNGGVGY